jgi:hypothetical protein
MTKPCPVCGCTVDPVVGRGRPKLFCSAPCRRLATAEVRRLDARIGRLEDELSQWRVTAEASRTGWERDPGLLAAEVARLRSRLLALLRAGDPRAESS